MVYKLHRLSSLILQPIWYHVLTPSIHPKPILYCPLHYTLLKMLSAILEEFCL